MVECGNSETAQRIVNEVAQVIEQRLSGR